MMKYPLEGNAKNNLREHTNHRMYRGNVRRER